jgi:hypothetical protein
MPQRSELISYHQERLLLSITQEHVVFRLENAPQTAVISPVYHVGARLQRAFPFITVCVLS